ncbi:MAG: pantoate--beta-alanine ligase [Bacteroidota bacterium]
MLVFTSKTKLKSFLKSKRTKNYTIGLVPTMGALHLGHISLVKQAISENDMVIVSIFVNPTQFNNKEDLLKYPKDLKSDQKQLENISNDIVVFAPPVFEVYSNKVKSKSYNFNGLDKVMEGEFREGHFNGVGTIIEELFTVIMPNKAYFGEKDFQQLQIIKKLTAIKKLPVQIIGCPIVRESNGLAMSSRNERLSKKLRKEAGLIYETLVLAKQKFVAQSTKQVLEWVEKRFMDYPEFNLEYFTITQVDTLRKVQRKHRNKKYRAFIAVYVQGIRLIDNIAL